MITQEELKNKLHYDQNTGIFKRIVGNRNQIRKMVTAGSLYSNGYIVISINNKKISAHRLAWLYMTSEWPGKYIDHINGIKNDNRWCNLREATANQNRLNSRMKCNNKYGLKGISFKKTCNKYVAQAAINGKYFHLGYFKSKEEASEAYNLFAKEHHGEFYRE